MVQLTYIFSRVLTVVQSQLDTVQTDRQNLLVSSDLNNLTILHCFGWPQNYRNRDRYHITLSLSAQSVSKRCLLLFVADANVNQLCGPVIDITILTKNKERGISRLLSNVKRYLIKLLL